MNTDIYDIPEAPQGADSVPMNKSGGAVESWTLAALATTL